MHDSVLCANGFWSRKFGLEIDEHIWSIPSLVTKTKQNKAMGSTVENSAYYLSHKHITVQDESER